MAGKTTLTTRERVGMAVILVIVAVVAVVLALRRPSQSTVTTVAPPDTVAGRVEVPAKRAPGDSVKRKKRREKAPRTTQQKTRQRDYVGEDAENELR